MVGHRMFFSNSLPVSSAVVGRKMVCRQSCRGNMRAYTSGCLSFKPASLQRKTVAAAPAQLSPSRCKGNQLRVWQNIGIETYLFSITHRETNRLRTNLYSCGKLPTFNGSPSPDVHAPRMINWQDLGNQCERWSVGLPFCCHDYCSIWIKVRSLTEDNGQLHV